MSSGSGVRVSSGTPPTLADADAVAALPAARRRAVLCVLAAALLWSSSGFFAKAPYFAGWPGPLLAFWRAAFASLVLLPMVRRPVWTWKLIPAVACFALMNYTYLTAMVNGSAANAIWMQNTAPMWVLLVGVFALKEPVHRLDWLFIVCCGLGVGLIVACESRGESLAAVLWGLASGLFYAGVVLSLRMLREYDSAWLVAVNHSATALLMSWNLQSMPAWPSPIQWTLLAGFGMAQMGMPYWLFARGLRSLPGHQAAGIGLLEPILVPVWVLAAWGERPAWWTLVGGGLILVGLAMRYVESLAKFGRVRPDAPIPERS